MRPRSAQPRAELFPVPSLPSPCPLRLHPVAVALQVRRRRAAGSNATRPLLGMMLENCHDDDGMSLGPEGRGGNAPYYRSDGELWCPFHTYRTSGDARPTYGSLMANLNSTRAMAARNLSVPGCVSCWPANIVHPLLSDDSQSWTHSRCPPRCRVSHTALLVLQWACETRRLTAPAHRLPRTI
jgi:hypothetical protein